MRGLKVIGLILLLAFSVKEAFAQSFYLKEFRDSTKAAIFGQVAFMDQDSLNLYLVANTTYSPAGICNSGNGLSFVFKISKSNGAIVSSNLISGNPYVSKINCGFKHNNSLYFGGEMANSTNNYSTIGKYDLIINQLVWFKPMTGFNSPINRVTSLKLNPSNSTLKFEGVNIYSWAISPSAFMGLIDTLGTYPSTMNFGYMNSGSVLLTNPDLAFSNLDSRFYTIISDFYTDSVYIAKTINWSNVATQWMKLNLKSDGSQFSFTFDKYILNIVNQNNSFTCFITDTLLNCIRAKNFPNIYFKSAGIDREMAVLTCVNYFGSGKGNEVINFKMDTAINILSCKRMFIDTFYVSNFTSSTVYNKFSDTYFNVFSKNAINAKALQLYKSNFSNLYCNEINFSYTTSSVAINGIPVSSSYTGGVGPTTVAVVTSPKGFTDTSICYSVATSIENSYLEYVQHTLYPNPTSSVLFLEFQNELEKPYNIQITDLSGREISKFSLEKSKQNLDVKNLHQGLYLINFYSETGLFLGSSKFIKSD